MWYGFCDSLFLEFPFYNVSKRSLKALSSVREWGRSQHTCNYF